MATWMQYPITQGFGPTAEPLDSGGFNKGYDYATPMGTPIEALVGGTVISAGDSGDGWGLSVKVQDEYGNTHNYGHLSEINVRPGQQVGGDMLLGLSGNSGKSTGPHLSYDVWDADGGYIDPAEYLGGSGGGGGAMPGQEEDKGWDAPWGLEWFDTDDGEQPTDDVFEMGDPSQSTYGRDLTDSDIGPLLESLGYVYKSGWGPTAIWAYKDDKGKDATTSQIAAADAVLGDLSPYNPKKATAATNPVVREVGGQLYQFDAKTGSWAPARGIPGSANPEYAKIWQQEYATKTTIDNFLQNKYDFEVRTGQTAEAAKTRQQLFSNNLAMQKLQMDMAKQQRDEQYRQATFKADLASKIGSLAANSGDRGEYAAFQLANGMWNGQQETKLAQGEDFHTEESLKPLNDLLGLGSSMGLGTTPAATAGAPASLNPINALPTMPNSMTASSKVAPQMPAVEPPPADGQNPTDLPLKAAGGIEDGAYISGEAGPEINIPLADGRTAILNADQARSVGINLDRVVKMATGGIFDSMAKDPASKFIDDAFNKAKAGTPWEAFNTAPTPIAAATPGMDPEVMKLMASLSQLKTGMPGSSFLRQAALLQPAGVNEGAIRRTA